MGAVENKVIVVVGGTSGIGEAIARLLAAEGAWVAVAGRRADRGQKLCVDLGADSMFVPVDIASESEVEALVGHVIKTWGRIDGMVNSAGAGGSPGGIARIDLERMRQTWDVHVGGTAMLMKHVAPVMVRQQSGSIINVSSVGAMIGGWTHLDYSAAKAAVIQLTRCVAVELAEHGVRVNSISPGPILTGIFAKGAGVDPEAADQSAGELEQAFTSRLAMWQPIGRAAVPDDVAGTALWLASDGSRFVTGQNIPVDGGITAGRPAAAAAADKAELRKILTALKG